MQCFPEGLCLSAQRAPNSQHPEFPQQAVTLVRSECSGCVCVFVLDPVPSSVTAGTCKRESCVWGTRLGSSSWAGGTWGRGCDHSSYCHWSKEQNNKKKFVRLQSWVINPAVAVCQSCAVLWWWVNVTNGGTWSYEVTHSLSGTVFFILLKSIDCTEPFFSSFPQVSERNYSFQIKGSLK